MKKKLDTLVILSPGFAANEADTTCLPPMQLFVKALKEICPGLNIIVIAFQYPFFADDKETMPMLVILGIGGALCGWSLLLIFSGERQRRLLEATPPAAPVKSKKKN